MHVVEEEGKISLKMSSNRTVRQKLTTALICFGMFLSLLAIQSYYYRNMGSPLSHYNENGILQALGNLHSLVLVCDLKEEALCFCPSDIQFTSACSFTAETDVSTKLCNKKQRQLSASNPKCSSIPQCQETPILFKQAMLQSDIDLYLDLLRVFSKAMDSVNVTHFVAGGTVIGSLRHHGFIPWDDDIDVYIPLSQKSDMLKALKPLEPLYHTAYRRPMLMKFYSYKSKRVKRFNYGWPQIDIFFYKSNATHLQFQLLPTSMVKPISFLQKNIFPLKERPFCDMTVYIPNKPVEYLQRLYPGFDLDVCVSRSLNHRRNEPLNFSVTGNTTFKCKEFNHVYPHVLRQEYNSTHVMEKMFIADKEINKIILNK